MTAEQTADTEPVGCARWRRLVLQCPLERNIDAARTADRELIVILRIAIDEELCIRQMLRRKVNRSRHTTFLIHRYDQPQRAMLLGIFEQIDALSHTDAIIRTETRSLGFEIFLAAHELDGITQRIIGIAILRDADHIHVSLQNRARRLLATGCRRCIRDDVIHLILNDMEPLLRQIRFQEVAHRLLFSALARNRC